MNVFSRKHYVYSTLFSIEVVNILEAPYEIFGNEKCSCSFFPLLTDIFSVQEIFNVLLNST